MDSVAYQELELAGQRFAVLPVEQLRELCDAAGIPLVPAARPAAEAPRPETETVWDQQQLGRRLRGRRLRCGLTQADLARQAGIRVETLNRLEKGRTNPDFSTIRKLVVAMEAAEAAGQRRS